MKKVKDKGLLYFKEFKVKLPALKGGACGARIGQDVLTPS